MKDSKINEIVSNAIKKVLKEGNNFQSLYNTNTKRNNKVAAYLKEKIQSIATPEIYRRYFINVIARHLSSVKQEVMANEKALYAESLKLFANSFMEYDGDEALGYLTFGDCYENPKNILKAYVSYIKSNEYTDDSQLFNSFLPETE